MTINTRTISYGTFAITSLFGLALVFALVALPSFASAADLPFRASCYPTPAFASVGQAVTWTANVMGGNKPYQFAWSGDEALIGSGSAQTKSYQTPGNKYAFVKVYSGGAVRRVDCSMPASISGTSVAVPQPTVQPSTPSANTNTNTNTNYNYNYNSSGPVAYAPTPVYNYPPSYPTYPTTYGSLQASCYPMPLSAAVGQNIVWQSSITGGSGSNYVTWTGDEALSGFGSTISKVYYTPGYKNASLTVTSGGQTISTNCSGAVNVYGSGYYDNYQTNYYPTNSYPTDYNYYNQYPTQPLYPVSNASGLQIGCYSDPAIASINQPITWNVEVTGGALPYSYSWTGSDGLSGMQSSVIKYYGTSGSKNAIVTVTSADGRTGTQACSNPLTIRGSGVTTPRAPAAPVTPPSQQTNGLSAASLFSLQNVPWGWVAVLVILVLFGTVMYLLFNRQKI